MSKEPTAEQWKAYELTQYNGRSLNQAADDMEVSRQHIVKLLADVKEISPVLFAGGTDRSAMSRVITAKHRPKMLSYSSEMDEYVADRRVLRVDDK